jgi:hypothetical protein
MNRQEMFDKVVDHLAAQKRPSVDNKLECRYRDPEGRKCAFGIFIPDELYDPGMESIRAQSLISGSCGTGEVACETGVYWIPAELKKHLSQFAGDQSFLQTLQGVHDSAHNINPDQPELMVKEWAQGLYNAASQYQLGFDKQKFIEQFNAS